jgi:hypothetical protein
VAPVARGALDGSRSGLRGLRPREPSRPLTSTVDAPTPDDVLAAIDAQAAFRVSDLQHGGADGGVTVRNPFVESSR